MCVILFVCDRRQWQSGLGDHEPTFLDPELSSTGQHLAFVGTFTGIVAIAAGADAIHQISALFDQRRPE